MNAVAIQSFGFGEKLVRVLDRAGAAWFVANDVCSALEIGNSRQAVSRLEEDEKGVITNDTLGGAQDMTIISESGVYALIFTSRKAAAKQFRKWVTQEVLPAIRTTGRYELVAAEPSYAAPERPDELEQLRTKLAIAREARIVFGLRAARKAWQVVGLLPGLTDDIDDKPSAIWAPPSILGRVHQTVLDWLDARCEAAPGHRVRTVMLYDNYLDWARRADVSANDVVNLSTFGAVMTNLGVPAIRSNGMHRIGLRMKAIN